MNKFAIIAAVSLFSLFGSVGAEAKTTKTCSTNVPLPPTRPAEFNAQNGTGALVTPQGVVVKAPVGSNVTVDVDGNDVDVQVDGATRGVAKVLPWNWSIWK